MEMMRQDAWTEEEDMLLAETVLAFVREGGTQLRAFEEVGKKLSRTAAACGFRWNAYVRKKYEQELELAKQQRKKKKEPHPPERDMTLQDVISFLQTLQQRGEGQQEIERLREQVWTLQKEKEALEKQLQAVQQEYQAVMHILERARQLSV
ncbi:MAG: RsfA family transcriptional regulator [Anoxybacillus gonensis]|nr:RsfA family transcriptional regulator [Anoxybacillus gonensis]